MKPLNFEEKLVWYAIIWTYPCWLIGGLYVLAPVLAWVLVGYLGWRLFQQTEATESKITIPFAVWVWVIGMLVMELALIMGHLDYDLSMDSLIKSSIGWAKGWALLALFPLVGCLNIRPQLLFRAACIVCLHTLIVIPLFYLGFFAHLPERLYISPLQAIGGPGPEFFAVQIYEVDPENGSVRFRLFTPWGPALGFVANIYFFFALQEPEQKWRWAGIVGCLAMCWVSASRLSILSIIGVSFLTWILARVSRPRVQIIAGCASLLLGILAQNILDAIAAFAEAFSKARAGSSRVRATLGRIASYRWEHEAPIWGHGIVERGPHLVEYMPIGSHHTWFGLLFVKGAVGFGALALPLLWSFVTLVIKAQQEPLARVGLSMVLVLFMYTFGENLEILAYLFWPGLVMMGIAFKKSTQSSSLAHKVEEKLVLN